jgi:hypothetical protein
MRINKYVLVIMMLVSAASLCAQDDDKPAPYKRPQNDYSHDTINTNKDELKTFENPKKKFDISKLLIEPNFQLYFNSYQYQFGLMPSIGYNVWKNLYVGGSINYSLTYEPHVDPSTSGSPSASLQVYGGGPFVHYRIWRGFFVRLRTEMLAVKYPDINYANDVTYATRGIPYIWMGGGYNLTASKNFFIPLAIYVNPLYGTYDGTAKSISPYSSWFYVQIAFYIL